MLTLAHYWKRNKHEVFLLDPDDTVEDLDFGSMSGVGKTQEEAISDFKTGFLERFEELEQFKERLLSDNPPELVRVNFFGKIIK